MIDFWQWWAIAILLIIVEILLPTFFALWMAVSAFLTGIALFLIPNMQWEYQIFLFALLAVTSLALWRFYYHKNPITTEQPSLNRRGEQYIGTIIALQAPIVGGNGQIKIDDTTWKIHGDDCTAGTKVKITAVHRAVFQVELII